MAVKTKAQVQALVLACLDVLEDAETHLSGDLMTNLAAVTTAIVAGDDQPEDAVQQAAVKAVISAGEGYYAACVALFRTLHPTLGRYSSSGNLADRERNLSAFHDKLTTDSEAVLSSGITKFSSWSAGGSNRGNGSFVVYNSDPAALGMDCSHVETLTLRCTKDAISPGVTEGAEEFELTGGAAADERWLEGGSAGGTYSHPLGVSTNLWSAAQPKVATGGKIKSVGAAKAAGNLLDNGDFESTVGSGTSKIPGWTITSGDSLLAAETTDEIEGDQSIKVTGNFVMYQSLERKAGIGTLRAYRLEAWGWVHANVTAGTFTVEVKDDSATHATVTVDITTLTNATDTKLTGVSFVLPRTVGANLRCEIAFASYAGSDHFIFDNVILAPLYLHDSGRCIGIVAGPTPFRANDTATGATTGTKTGPFQKALNRHEGRYVKHADPAVGSWA